MSTDMQLPKLEPLRYPEQDPKLTKGNFWDLLTIVGPGFILASVTIGNGEIFFATRGGAIFGYTLLWTFVIGAIMKAAVAYAAGRYIIITGEHPFARFGHVLPAPKKGPLKHWLALVLGVLAVICFPNWCVAYVFALSQWTPWTFGMGDDKSILWMGIAWGVLAWLTLFIKDFTFVERFQTFVVLIMVVFSIVAVFVSNPDWLAVLRGIIPGWPSEYPGWVQANYPDIASRPVAVEILAYIGALGGGAYDYIGYIGTFREKTWGMMGREDNAEINLKLQALGPEEKVPIAMDEENLARAAAGVKAAKIDTVTSFVAVGIFAMTFMILGTVILGDGGSQSVPDNTNILRAQAGFFTMIHPALKYLYQVAIWCAFWGSMQALLTTTYPYTFRESFAPAFPAINDPKNWQKVRFGVATYTFGGALFLVATQVSYTTAITFAGILGGVFALGVWGFLQFPVEAKMLPKELRMSTQMKVILFISSLTMLVMGVYGLIEFFMDIFS